MYFKDLAEMYVQCMYVLVSEKPSLIFMIIQTGYNFVRTQNRRKGAENKNNNNKKNKDAL